MQWQTLDKLSFSEMKYKELLIIYRISALFEIIQPKLTLLYLLNILLINSKKNFQKPLNSKHLSYYKELKLRISLYLNHNLTFLHKKNGIQLNLVFHHYLSNNLRLFKITKIVEVSWATTPIVILNPENKSMLNAPKILLNIKIVMTEMEKMTF